MIIDGDASMHDVALMRKVLGNDMIMMMIPIQDLQGSVRQQGGLQDHPKPDFESIFKM